ncbi:pyrroline-5-carboxylate reductase [Photobacterium satsumensis]|uniref:pyrroline-5-carboxylate reductase n=1 Tax=Photobacterium satsumensis TaxID=2910239 RepID=UPI003D0D0847
MNSTSTRHTMKHTGPSSILVIGCGKMGSAIIQGWLNDSIDGRNIYIVDPNIDALQPLVQAGEVKAYATPTALPAIRFDFVMVAIKPQMVQKILPLYRDFIHSDATLISVAAGVTNASLGELIPNIRSIIRVMPNTPALVQRGVMVGCANQHVSEQQRSVCKKLFSLLGNFYWVEDESLMDAVTAVSGSGPAYLFHFTECLIDAAKKVGLPEDLAKALAINTVTGAAHLVSVEEKEVSELRQDVTSPKGTTEAALNIFMAQQELNQLVSKAVNAASKRSKELAELV